MATPEWIKKEIRENYAKATLAGRRAERTEARAAKASYVSRRHALQIEMTNGVVIIVPIRRIPWLKRASPRDLREVEVLGRGGGLHWESMDMDLSVPNLVSSLFDSSTWMAELGRRGGRSSSAAKATAARRNGRKGGRPRNRVTATP